MMNTIVTNRGLERLIREEVAKTLAAGGNFPPRVGKVLAVNPDDDGNFRKDGDRDDEGGAPFPVGPRTPPTPSPMEQMLERAIHCSHLRHDANRRGDKDLAKKLGTQKADALRRALTLDLHRKIQVHGSDQSYLWSVRFRWHGRRTSLHLPKAELDLFLLDRPTSVPRPIDRLEILNATADQLCDLQPFGKFCQRWLVMLASLPVSERLKKRTSNLFDHAARSGQPIRYDLSLIKKLATQQVRKSIG